MKIIIQECKNCGGPVHLNYEDWVHDRDNENACDFNRWLAWIQRNEGNLEDLTFAQPIRIEGTKMEAQPLSPVDLVFREATLTVPPGRYVVAPLPDKP